jgi:hypothetical protein
VSRFTVTARALRQRGRTRRPIRPLDVRDRDAFLQAVAEVLQGHRREIGDGDVHRAVMGVQRRFYDPPELDQRQEAAPSDKLS